MTAIAQPALTKGEISPSLYGRIDLAAYYTALKTCRNFIVRPYGGVENRPGSRFVTEGNEYVDYGGVTSAEMLRMVIGLDPNPNGYDLRDALIAARQGDMSDVPANAMLRLIPFVYSSGTSFVLVFGHEYFRVIHDGGLVLDGGTLEPVEVVTPYQGKDLSLITFTQSGDIITLCHPDYPVQQLARYANDNWQISEFANVEGPFQEINIDQGKTIKANAYSGNTTLTATGWEFNAGMVGQMIRIEQSPDSVTKAWEVQTDITVNEVRKAGSSYYQALTGGKSGTIRPTVLEGVEADGSPGITWKYLHSGYGIARITGYTSATVVTGVVLSRLPDSVCAGTLTRAITAVNPGAAMIPGEGGAPDTPQVDARITAPAHGFSNGDAVTLQGIVGIDGLNGVTAQVIVVDANTFDFSGIYGTGAYVSGGTAAKALTGATTYKWAVEAWGGDQGYPAACSYYQQRQVFGGTTAKPQMIWMSRSAGFTDFGTSIPMLDDDAVSIELAAESRNEIRHMIRLSKLITLTSEAAWVIEKKAGEALPNTDPQEETGISRTVRPLKVGSKTIFVENKASVVRSLGYSYTSDSFEGEDLTVTAAHLFKGRTVVDWAYQRTPFRCSWVVMSDGALLGLTYMPDQQVVGWHRHDTDGLYQSVCCVPEGSEDTLYAVVKRQIGGVWKWYVERFATRNFTDVRDAYFLDCGLSYDGRAAGAGVPFTISGGVTWSYEETLTFTTSAPFFTGTSDEGDVVVLHDAEGVPLRLAILTYVSATVARVLANRTIPEEFQGVERTGFEMARNTFVGLDHLNGKTVSILADGVAELPATVGAVSGGIGFQLANPAVVVHAGLPIEADIETLNVNVQGQSIQGKMKNVRSVTLIVENTRGLQAGPDGNNLIEISPLCSGEYDNPISLDTGPITANIISDWSDGGRVLLRQSYPLPASILAIIPEVQVGGL